MLDYFVFGYLSAALLKQHPKITGTDPYTCTGIPPMYVHVLVFISLAKSIYETTVICSQPLRTQLQGNQDSKKIVSMLMKHKCIAIHKV